MSDVIPLSFRIHARMSVMSEAKGLQLSKPEIFDHIATVDELHAHDTQAAPFKALVEASLKAAYVAHFVKRLREDSALKHRIGKTKWLVHIHEYTAKQVV